MNELLYESDWLGSDPCYYNEVTGLAGRSINDVIDFANLEFDPEGLGAYLGTGFSVFQHTPVQHVRFLPPSSRLWRDEEGCLSVEEVPLDLDARLAGHGTADEALDLLRSRVRSAEQAAEGDIVIPRSGGYDSRLLNLMVAEPARVRSFTFGPTARQWDSAEVARARALSEMLGTRWERIPIGGFHDYLDDWDSAFGPSLHAHGMYHMEFYSQVRAKLGGAGLVFSGIFGDWMEGKGDRRAPPVSGPSDVHRLIFNYAQRADSSMSRLRWRGTLCEEYFENNRDALASHRRRLVEVVRFRMMFLHYMLRVPSLFGFQTAAPFLDLDVAVAMLTLPDERRSKRLWVRDYLVSRGALLEDVAGNGAYWLYWPAMRRLPLKPLDDALLAELVRPEYVRWINRTVGWRGLWWEGYERLGNRRGFRRAANRLRELGLRQRRLEAYHAYMTLRPLERLLRRRDAARCGAA